MRRVRGRRLAGDADREPAAEVAPRRLVVAAEALEALLLRVGRGGMVDDVVPVARDARASARLRAADRRAEARVRDGERPRATNGAHSGRARSATRGSGRARSGARVAGVVALAAAERLDHVADGVRVPVVDEQRPRRPLGRRRPPATPDHGRLQGGRRCHGRHVSSVDLHAPRGRSIPRAARSRAICARSGSSRRTCCRPGRGGGMRRRSTTPRHAALRAEVHPLELEPPAHPAPRGERQDALGPRG